VEKVKSVLLLHCFAKIEKKKHIIQLIMPRPSFVPGNCTTSHDCPHHYVCYSKSYIEYSDENQCLCNKAMLYYGDKCQFSVAGLLSWIFLLVINLLLLLYSLKVLFSRRKMYFRNNPKSKRVFITDGAVSTSFFIACACASFVVINIVNILRNLRLGNMDILYDDMRPCSVVASGTFCTIAGLNISFLWIEISQAGMKKINNLQRKKKIVFRCGAIYFFITFVSTYTTSSLRTFSFSTIFFELLLAINFLIGRTKIVRALQVRRSRHQNEDQIMRITNLTFKVALSLLLHILFSIAFGVFDTMPQLGLPAHYSSVLMVLVISFCLGVVLKHFQQSIDSQRTETRGSLIVHIRASVLTNLNDEQHK